jgi:GGDEF domain-containing protein
MIFDPNSVPDEVTGLLEEDKPCVRESVFFFFLESELARAQRYNFFTSLILFTIEGHEEAEQLRNLAAFLNSRVRVTDLVGCLGDKMLGVVLLNSNLENADQTARRLTREAKLHLVGNDPNLLIKSAAAVYPTEASSVGTLYSRARTRLEKSMTY